MKRLFLTVLMTITTGLALLDCSSAQAGQQTLNATNSSLVLAGTTNLLNPGFAAGQSSDLTFSPICVFTNATTNTFVFDASADNANWVTRLMTMTASQTGTGTNTVIAGITNLPAAFRYPYWRVWVENPSIYATTPKVAGFSKTGL